MSENAGGGALKTAATFSTGVVVVVAMAEEYACVLKGARVEEE